MPDKIYSLQELFKIRDSLDILVSLEYLQDTIGEYKTQELVSDIATRLQITKGGE